MSIRVLIVATHPLFSEGLASCVDCTVPDAMFDYKRCLDDVMTFPHQGRSYGLIFLDVNLPRLNGFSGLLALRKRFPITPIVVVSGQAGPSVVRNAIVFGATGFIAKAASSAGITSVIKGVLNGKRMIALGGERAGEGREMCQSLGLDRNLESLSKKQAEVLDMMCRGLFNKEIADALDLQTTTVKAHITEVLRKLRVLSRTKAVIEASSPHTEEYVHPQKRPVDRISSSSQPYQLA